MAQIPQRNCACLLLSFHGQFVSAFLSITYAFDPRLTLHASAFESGGVTISCTVLYPEQFDALRRTYDCERNMIESLARCVKWDASGGKSGSAFLKTLGELKWLM